MTPMNTIRSLLELHEAERLKPYKDTVGKITIGVGRNLDDVGISREESQYLLTNDLIRVDKDLATLPWTKQLDPIRYAVLQDMCFNLGLGRLKGFKKFLAAMATSNWAVAAVEMLDSKWAQQVGLRSTRLRDMVLTGQWPKA
jgi:lysozyme